MGDDGAEAMARLRAGGGLTIAQDEETSVVFGMPQELIKRGGASVVLPSDAIAEQLIGWLGARRPGLWPGDAAVGLKKPTAPPKTEAEAPHGISPGSRPPSPPRRPASAAGPPGNSARSRRPGRCSARISRASRPPASGPSS